MRQTVPAVIDDSMGGLLALHIDVVGQKGDMIKAKTLAAFQKIEDWTKEYPEFITAQSPATLGRELNRSLTGQNVVPDTDALAAQLFFLAQGQALMSRILYEDHDRARMLITVRDDGSSFRSPNCCLADRDCRNVRTFGVTSGTHRGAFCGL